MSSNNSNSYEYQYQQHPLPSIFVSQQQPQPDFYSSQFIQYAPGNNLLDYNYQQTSLPQQQRVYSTLPIPNYHYNNQTTSPQKYPISPISISDREHNGSVSYQTQYNFSPPSTANIDYSSLVSYTISPSLKRKRRKRKVETTPQQEPLESYPCKVCNKVFQKPYNLKSHMKTHSTEKPFQCCHCSKTFARSHDKKRHELLHQGVKNFKCEGYLQDGITKWGCGKKFARSDALSRHFRTETGWLCIRPLMDEAKRLEQETGISNIQFNVGVLPTQYDEKNDDTYDNSNFIRKLIQGK
ncbi:unnamed protein product [Candida verbasci]|uniref:C2H2-type domain-containing protein n=1 Tax=Candida verbasci TaxID=1227364 RepID=A0A9W4TQZ8_9ASCO|nr:unnamed protein product [Candida verbasci]